MTAKSALSNLKLCAEYAPEGTYEDAKRLNDILGDAMDSLMQELRAEGLKANASDLAFELEAAMYHYVKESNPDATLFPVSEGFGSSMNGPAHNRVIAQAESNRDFLIGAGAE